jgi:RHS repeat-associated protein
MTLDQNGKTLVFDAWNRLVAYKNGVTVLVSYSYDALNRRVTENPGTARTLYYSSAWQVLEEDVSGAPQIQYVWSPVYVDAMIERDRDADGNPANGLEERLYVQQDGNWNVTAVLNTSSVVQERYVEDPYGAPTILDSNWITRASSLYAWNYLHQGGRYDSLSGLYQFRNRDYSASLGRWLENDPLSFRAGDENLYRYLADQPVTGVDPNGTVSVFIRGYDGPSGSSDGGDNKTYNWVDRQFTRGQANKVVKFVTESVGPPDQQSEPIIIIGHSLGGATAVDIVKKLTKLGYQVDFLVTLDPVPTGFWSILGSPDYFERPAGVKLAWNWKQMKDEPRGSEMVGADRDIWTDLGHTEVNQDKAISDQIKLRATQFADRWGK